MTASRQGLFYAVAAVFFFSTSPVLIRWAAPLPPFQIAAGRLAVAGAALYLVRRLRREKARVLPGDRFRFAAFGLVAGLHFFFYIASLQFTTISHSLALVYTAPIFVTILSARLLAEPLPRRKWAGVFVAVGGIAVLAGFQPAFTRRMLFGDLLALASALMFGFYSVAGRSQRERMPLATYAFAVYSIAALWLLPAAAMTTAPGPVPGSSWVAVAVLGLVPLAAGHTLYNAALRRMHATSVNLIATQEVTGGIVLGAVFLREIPTWNEILGAALALGGVAMVIL
jgi:drug/metabolite transporter (DMT)-like permease